MAEFKAKVQVKCTETSLRVLNTVACVGIVFTNILRYFVKNEKSEGIDKIPYAQFFIQTVLTIMFAILV